MIGVTGGNQAGPPVEYFTFRRRVATGAGEFAEDTLVRGVHPLVGRRLHLWRLQNFHVTRVGGLAADPAAGPVPEGVLLYHCVAKDNAADQRLVALAQVHRFEVARGADGQITGIEDAETVLAACVDAIGRARHDLDPAGRWLDMNHVWLDIRPVVNMVPRNLAAWQRATAPLVAQAGIQEVLVHGRVANRGRCAPLRGDPALLRARRERRRLGGRTADSAASAAAATTTRRCCGHAAAARYTRTSWWGCSLARAASSPNSICAAASSGQARPRGYNTAGIVAGLVSTPTPLHPEGIRRVVLFGDPTKALGALAEPECARIIAALDLAEREGLPLEWFAVSSGARISMDSGTENMDWIARVLRRIVEFTQAGGEINIVVAGINVGAQPYWNAEATMLMHTSGILGR